MQKQAVNLRFKLLNHLNNVCSLILYLGYYYSIAALQIALLFFENLKHYVMLIPQYEYFYIFNTKRLFLVFRFLIFK